MHRTITISSPPTKHPILVLKTLKSHTPHRYSFNGMERDDEIKGAGNSLDFGARIYDSRIGRWLARDPLEIKYPMLSSYCFVANSPLVLIDPDGRKIAGVKNIIRGDDGTIKKIVWDGKAENEDVVNLRRDIEQAIRLAETAEGGSETIDRLMEHDYTFTFVDLDKRQADDEVANPEDESVYGKDEIYIVGEEIGFRKSYQLENEQLNIGSTHEEKELVANENGEISEETKIVPDPPIYSDYNSANILVSMINYTLDIYSLDGDEQSLKQDIAESGRLRNGETLDNKKFEAFIKDIKTYINNKNEKPQ